MKEYETIYQHQKYGYSDIENSVLVLKDGKAFGSKDRDNYIRALLSDIESLSKSNAELFHFKQTTEIVLCSEYLQVIFDEMERKEN